MAKSKPHSTKRSYPLQYHIRIRGEQRPDIDSHDMAEIVIMLGRQLAEEAKDKERDIRQNDK